MSYPASTPTTGLTCAFCGGVMHLDGLTPTRGGGMLGLEGPACWDCVKHAQVQATTGAGHCSVCGRGRDNGSGSGVCRECSGESEPWQSELT